MTVTRGIPGPFGGGRAYRLAPRADASRRTVRADYGGPLAGLIGRSIPDLDPSFQQFADGLPSGHAPCQHRYPGSSTAAVGVITMDAA